MRSLLNETGAACVSLLVVMSAWHGEAAGRKLVWSDEFDGTELDRSKWGYETGFVRNREYQYYTDRRENVRVENGRLVIEGRREDFPNAAYDPAAPTNEWQHCRKIAAYTSGSINTLGKFGFRYGRIECRAKVPQGAGTWPAFWMMGTDFAEVSWPKCGEIDVLEYLGKDPDRVTCNLHGWSPEKAKNQSGYLCGGMSKLDGVAPTDGFHVYAAEWDEKGVTMFYDDRPYGRYSFDAYDRKDGGNCFRKPHFILLNLALGAEWMLPMDKMTRDFPLRFEIDWIRVYDRADEGWKPLPLWGGGYMQDVIISPSEPNVWYCHADVCGPFRSDDAGRSWKPLHQNFPAAWRNTKVDHVRGVLVDPRNANRVLVAGGDNWNFTGGGIVVSDDGGRTWRMTLKGAHFYGNGPRRMYGRVLSRDPFNPDRIVAGEDRDGLWLSRDNGETWKNLGLTNHWFTCVAFDTAKEGRIWATSFAFATKKPEFARDVGFYRSDDFGETWTRLPCEPPANEFTQLTKGGPILAIFENRFPRFSSDGGLTWQDAFEGLDILSAPPKNPWDHGNFYALGAGKDFYLLGDGGGRIWRRGEHETAWVEHKMTSRAVGDPPCEMWVAERTRHQEAMSQFTIDPRDENHWLTTDWFAIWETTDAGKSFVSRVKGISEVVPFCLAFDPNSVTNIAYGLADQGLFVSNDGGRSYYPPIAKPGTPEQRCEIVTCCGNSLAYSTRTPGLLYVTGGKGEPIFRVSVDAGRTWTAPALRGLPAGMRNGGIAPYAVSVHPVTDDVWITMGGPVGRGKGGIYRSSDRGESWTWAGDGLPEGERLFKNTEFGNGGGAEIYFSADGSAAVAHARVAGTVFWLDVTDGLWRAVEGLPANSRNKLVADNFTPGRFLIAGSPARESTDGGRTWHPLKGLEKIGMTCGLAADAATPGLFAAVGYDAIYVSRDGAKTFTLLPGAFETVPSSLSRTIYLDRGRLYFLTTGTGVWVCSVCADGVPLEWNTHAEWFMYAPAFAFREIPGAVRYRFRTIDDCHVVRDFTADRPTDSLAPVWGKLPKGFVTVTCFALDGKDAVIGLAGERTFWKNAPFREGAYPKAKRSYAEAVNLGLSYLLDRPSNRYFLENGVPDPSYDLNCYPAKMHASTVAAMCVYLKTSLPRKDEAMRLARLSADYLLKISEPEGRPLAGWPHTYEGRNLTAAQYAGQQMLIYPARVGCAFLSFHAATGDEKYLAAAKRIAETYLRLQGGDGTWYLKLYEKDGKPVSGNRLMPSSVIDFLERLHDVTGDERCRVAADRAFAFVDKGPLRTWNWEGQFEDVAPSEPYSNLTKHSACDTAIYLFRRFPKDAYRIRQARSLLRFAEDQFIAWETPARKDGMGFRNRPGFKARCAPGWQTQYSTWHCPAVMEQYEWYLPIDASAAKLIRAYLACHEATGDSLALAKAKALGDAAVNNQREDGLSPTGWFGNYDQYDNWINCHIGTVLALRELDRPVSNGTKAVGR